MNLLFSLVILLFSLIPISGLASSLDCIGSDGKWHVLDSDPSNGNNIVIDDIIYRPVDERIIGNKKVSTFVDDFGIIANVILIIVPETNSGDIYIVIYSEYDDRRDKMKLHLHCSI